MCVRPSSGCVRRPRPIRLASTDVSGSEECEECGGAGAGVSILGPGQKREGLAQYRQTVQLRGAGRLPGRLVGERSECCKPAGHGLLYFYGNCNNKGLLEAKVLKSV